MKITHNKVGQNLNLTDSSRTDKSKKSDAAADAAQTAKVSALPFSSSSDSAKVDLSTRSQDIQRARELAMAVPEVDTAKVEKFQKLIDEGKYKIDAKAIAEKMVDEQLMAGKSSNE